MRKQSLLPGQSCAKASEGAVGSDDSMTRNYDWYRVLAKRVAYSSIRPRISQPHSNPAVAAGLTKRHLLRRFPYASYKW